MVNLTNKVNELNSLLSHEIWLDMELFEIRKGCLTIIGSIDFTYGHSIEIRFEDVFYLNLRSEWTVETSNPFLKIVDGDEAYSINLQFRIESGYTLFKIIHEDANSPFYIAAKSLSYNTDRVLYYKKEKLEKNERLADWLK